jgi:hypothetical protein
MEESADGGDYRASACSVNQIESVADSGQLDITHGRRGDGPQLLDERARLADRNEAVAAPVYHQKRRRVCVDPVHR